MMPVPEYNYSNVYCRFGIQMNFTNSALSPPSIPARREYWDIYVPSLPLHNTGSLFCIFTGFFRITGGGGEGFKGGGVEGGG